MGIPQPLIMAALSLHLFLSVPTIGLLSGASPAAKTQRLEPPVMVQRDASARAAARAAGAGSVQPTNRHQAAPPQRAPPETRASRNVVQGGSLRTWSHLPSEEQHISLGTNGRPLHADVEVWDGPGNTPVSMRVYGEDGQQRPVQAVIRGRGTPSTVAIRNTGPMEFPIAGHVAATRAPTDTPSRGRQQAARQQSDMPSRGRQQAARQQSAAAMRIQGGAERTYPFDASVGSVQVVLTSDGMPITATIEILQGPNTNRQGIELYSENGRDRPVSYVLETPGYYGCVVEITNTGPMEYPLTASVVPHSINEVPYMYDYDGMPNGGDYEYGRSYGQLRDDDTVY